MTTYAMRLANRYDGMVVATFPDVPEAVGYGRDDEEAREEGLKALEAALADRLAADEPLPAARAGGGVAVTAAALAAAEPASV